MNEHSDKYSQYGSGRSYRHRERSRERDDKSHYRSSRSRYDSEYRSRDSQSYSNNTRSHSCSPNRNHSSYRDDDHCSRRHSRRTAPRESNIILVRGIPRRFTEQQLTAAIVQTTTTYEQLTLFQNSDYNSRNSAVLRFKTTPEAQDFISAHPRGLYIGNYSASIYFGTGYDEGFWTCAECSVVNHETRSYCLQCGVLNKGSRDQTDLSGNINYGERDIGYEPSHILLVRGLDTLTTGEDIFNCANKITSVHRIWLIKDRLTKVSCGFGFLELSSLSDAIELINSLSGYYEIRSSLVIGNRTVTPCFAHSQSLVPAQEPSEWTIWGTDNVPYQYWDSNLYLSEFPEVAPPSIEPSITSSVIAPTVSIEAPSRSTDLAAELEAFDAFIGEVAEDGPTTETVSKAEVTPVLAPNQSVAQFQYFAAPSLNFDIKKLNSLSASESDSTSKVKPKELEKPSSAPSQTIVSGATTVGDAVSYAVPSNPERETENPNTFNTELNSAKPLTELSDKELDDIVLDYSKLICRLCLRQFRDSKDLDKHKTLSNLHKSNLKDSSLVNKIVASLENSETSQYRDRAKEMRRQASQEKAAQQQNHVQPEFVEPTPETFSVSNVASRLMSKMGWKEGQGLGKDGTGICEPIQGKIYARGAGIGSSQLRTAESEASEKYHDRVKRTSWARYQEDY